MSKYRQGKFVPTNPDKYVGTYPILARSSWEFAVMRKFDKHPSILQWASESIKIPYYNPIKRKQSIYVPDFLIVYEDKNGKRHAELIEVKPIAQASLQEAKSKYDKLSLAVNAAKWDAASKFCQRNGMRFRIITERDLFFNPKR